MNNLIDLVSEIKRLVDTYGADYVRKTLEFVTSVESLPIIRVGVPNTSLHVDLTPAEYAKIKEAYSNGYGKIQAIKVLRDLKVLSLRDAKDLVESSKWL